MKRSDSGTGTLVANIINVSEISKMFGLAVGADERMTKHAEPRDRGYLGRGRIPSVSCHFFSSLWLAQVFSRRIYLLKLYSSLSAFEGESC